ncbi:MAG: copper oxidase [Candidatus Aminicenantes bacterium]|nr:MAG: copper oxidase [Candidatus Aminicenantes bacterium]
MNRVKYVFFYLLETILRFLPLPQKTGLIKIGHPNKNSPVLVTGNYHLTVLKVLRALKGQNVFLLVANSRGINVWCAAAGGHFTFHDVISALKLSNIESLVDHREVILPQLAACGIEAKVIHQRTGWNVKWGPVHIKDFLAYLEIGQQKSIDMSIVRFPMQDRLEMSIAWASWMSAVFFFVLWIFKREAAVPAIFVVWLLTLFVFSAFPVYLPLLRPGVKKRLIFMVSFLFLALAGLGIFSLLTSHFTAHFLLFWGIISFITVLLLGGDIAGSTPFLISEFREEKGLQIEVDSKKCRGDGICMNACPLDCFILDKQKQLVIFERPEKCICCGACVVQCQFDALSYVDYKGHRVPPDFIRRHKVGFSGKWKPRY